MLRPPPIRLAAGGPNFTQAEEREIARLADKHGWQHAAHDYMRLRNHRAYRLAVDEYIAQLRFMLPIGRDDAVLHLGCGWGALSVNLASCARFVVAMDDREAHLRFVSARRTTAAADARLRILYASPISDLPLRDGAFDAVVVSDLPGQAAAHRSALRRLLGEARRVLQPGGWLLLAFSNRLAPWLGASYRGARASVREAGFSLVQCHVPVPSHRQPFFTVPGERSRLAEHVLAGVFDSASYRARLAARGLGPAFRLARSGWWLIRAMRLTGWLRYVAPSYCVVARAA